MNKNKLETRQHDQPNLIAMHKTSLIDTKTQEIISTGYCPLEDILELIPGDEIRSMNDNIYTFISTNGSSNKLHTKLNVSISKYVE